MAEDKGQRHTHFSVRAAALKLAPPPGVQPVDELFLINELSRKNRLPLTSAALLNFAYNTLDLSPPERILEEPNILLGDTARRVLELGNIFEGYQDRRIDDYIGDAGRGAFPTKRDLKARQRRAMAALRSIYKDLGPEVPVLYAQAANYVGGMGATVALLRRHNDHIYDRHANIPSLAATAAMELAASIDVDFKPEVLPVFPHPETGEPLTLQTFEMRGV